jgi:hypothetical protein
LRSNRHGEYHQFIANHSALIGFEQKAFGIIAGDDRLSLDPRICRRHRCPAAAATARSQPKTAAENGRQDPRFLQQIVHDLTSCEKNIT